jgi:hypothetical protein
MKVFESRTEGRRKVGRPRLRLLEVAENDLLELKMNILGQKKVRGKSGWWRRRRTCYLHPELLRLFYTRNICNCNEDQVESEIPWWITL